MASVNGPVRGVGAVVNGWSVLQLSEKAAALAMGQRRITVVIPEMIRVQGGTFSMGSTRFTHTQPVREITLTEYAIGKYPVTNAQWLGYLQVTERTIPKLVANIQMSMHPVVNVSWTDAMDYCEFLTELTGREFGLPTEAQWEFAARGTDRNEYPWGKYFDANKVVSNISGTQPVDTLPDGKSWCDARDMSGNVWELAFDWYKNKYDTKDLMNPKGPQSGTYKVRRGGSFCSDGLTDMRGASRDPVLPGYRDYDFGFRVSEVLI